MVIHASDEQCLDVAALCITYLLDRCSGERGLFKIIPDMTDTHAYFRLLRQGTITKLRDENITNFVHVVLGTLLLALREMRYSLLHEMYMDMMKIESIDMEDNEDFVERMTKLFRLLPTPQFNIAKLLFSLLYKVGTSSSSDNQNESGIDFVAHTIAAYICRLPEHESAFMSIRHSRDLALIRPVLATIIDNQATIFKGLLPNPAVVSAHHKMTLDHKLSPQPSQKSLSPSSQTKSFTVPNTTHTTHQHTTNAYLPHLHLSVATMDNGAAADTAMDVVEPVTVDNTPHKGGSSGAHTAHNINMNTWEWKVFKSLVGGSVQVLLGGGNPICGHSFGSYIAPSSSGVHNSPAVRRTSMTSEEGDDDINGSYGHDESLLAFRNAFVQQLLQKDQVSHQDGISSPKMSNAYIRRQMVNECRKLRGQIYKFEEEWVSLHGRLPKTSSERGPMQHIYSKYRFMKKEIRYMAIVSIQKICRGYAVRRRVRSVLNGDNSVSVFHNEERLFNTAIETRGADGGSLAINDLETVDYYKKGKRNDATSTAMEVCSVPPLANNSADNDALSLSNSFERSGKRRTVNPPAPGTFSGGRPLTPAVSTHGTSAGLVSSTAINSQSFSYSTANASVTASTSVKPSAVSDLYGRYRELLSAKKDLKKTLKKFDEDFAFKYGRQPKKAEKEVMRPMYQKYHEVKHDMDVLRATIESKHGPMPSDDDEAMANAGAGSVGDDKSASTASTTTLPMPIRERSVSEEKVFEGVDDPGSIKQTGRKELKSGGSGASVDKSVRVSAEGGATSLPVTSSELSTQDLAVLQEEKKSLHSFLKTYEKDFSKTNGRPVMRHDDILPVASEYQRYKDLKSLLKDAPQV